MKFEVPYQQFHALWYVTNDIFEALQAVRL